MYEGLCQSLSSFPYLANKDKCVASHKHISGIASILKSQWSYGVCKRSHTATTSSQVYINTYTSLNMWCFKGEKGEFLAQYSDLSTSFLELPMQFSLDCVVCRMSTYFKADC